MTELGNIGEAGGDWWKEVVCSVWGLILRCLGNFRVEMSTRQLASGAGVKLRENLMSSASISPRRKNKTTFGEAENGTNFEHEAFRKRDNEINC